MNKNIIIFLTFIVVFFLSISGLGFYYLFFSGTNKALENTEKNIIVPHAQEEVPQVSHDVVESLNVPTALEEPEKVESVSSKNSIFNPMAKPKAIEEDEAKKNSKDPSLVTTEEQKIEEDNSSEVGGILVRGHVIDLKTSKPIQDVSVDFYTSDAIFLKHVMTNKDGAFEVPHLKGERFNLRVSQERYVNLTLKDYSVAQLSEHLLLKLDPGNVISGQVKDKATQAVLSGVSIELYRGNILVKKSVVTNGEGRFQLDAAPSGQLELFFSKTGYTSATEKINIENSDISGIQVALDKASSLTIEVKTAGDFVEIPKISVYFDGSKDPLSYERSILTDDAKSNIFRIAGLEKPYSRLRVHAEGFTYPPEKQISIIPGQETKVDFEVSQGLKISGKITNLSGTPLKDVPVRIYEIFGAGRAVGDDIFKGAVTSDDKGEFVMTGIMAGNLEILITSNVYKRFQKKYSIADGQDLTVEITLEVENFFTGKLKNAAGELLAADEVRMTPILETGGYDPKRDRPMLNHISLGEFKMSGVVAGLYRLSITASGYSALIIEKYEVKPSQTIGDFVLDKGASLSGEVKTESGISLPGCVIQLNVTVKGSNVKYRSETDMNGFFSVQGLEEGVTYRLLAQAKGYQMYEEFVTLRASMGVYKVILKKKVVFSGVVLDANTRSPIQNFQVKVIARLEQGLVDDSTESFNSGSGQFSVPVSSNTFDVEIRAAGYANYSLKNMKANDPIQNHLLVKSGSVVFSVKYGSEPASMKAIKISKMRDVESDPNKRLVYTDSLGNAIIQNLEPGEYFIRMSNMVGFANYDGSVIITEGWDTSKEINLIAGLSLRGRVLDEKTHVPVTAGEVFLDEDLYLSSPLRIYLNADGFFEFKNVNVGKHTVTLYYGPMIDSKFTKKITISTEVPDIVNNVKGVFTMPEIKVR